MPGFQFRYVVASCRQRKLGYQTTCHSLASRSTFKGKWPRRPSPARPFSQDFGLVFFNSNTVFWVIKMFVKDPFSVRSKLNTCTSCISRKQHYSGCPFVPQPSKIRMCNPIFIWILLVMFLFVLFIFILFLCVFHIYLSSLYNGILSIAWFPRVLGFGRFRCIMYRKRHRGVQYRGKTCTYSVSPKTIKKTTTTKHSFTVWFLHASWDKTS